MIFGPLGQACDPYQASLSYANVPKPKKKIAAGRTPSSNMTEQVRRLSFMARGLKPVPLLNKKKSLKARTKYWKTEEPTAYANSLGRQAEQPC